MFIFKTENKEVSSESAAWLSAKRRTDNFIMLTKIGILAIFLA